ncbi:MAG: SIS domain-containing protein [Acutalibacteraceae bacterium]|nr:SIS domain-containing protein [Acutalibacteraceae bacterium]
MKESTLKILNQLTDRYPALADILPHIQKAAEIIADAYKNGGKLMLCGNGGSASDSLHIVGELMKEFAIKRPLSDDMKKALLDAGDDGYIAENLQGALPAVSLVGVTALESAYANDAAPDLGFAQQVLGLGCKGDVLFGITTSGNSKNVIYAVKTAKAKGIKTVVLTGCGGGKIKELCDCAIVAPANETYKIQEYHLPIYHNLCLALENEFFK